MRPNHLTRAANAICEPAGITVRYEWDMGRFGWSFYCGARVIKRIKAPRAVVGAAQGLADKEKAP